MFGISPKQEFGLLEYAYCLKNNLLTGKIISEEAIFYTISVTLINKMMELIMFKKLTMVLVSLLIMMSFAFAAVEVNKADQAGLDGIKGIGPSLSKAILAERTRGGDFKDWADFQKRVKGVGEKNSVKFSVEGLLVNGQPKPGVENKFGKVNTKEKSPSATDNALKK